MYRYKLHFEDGSEAGDAAYALPVSPGEEIIAAGARKFRVLDLVLIDEEEASPYVGLLRVEPA
jgi:hypothetical protein